VIITQSLFIISSATWSGCYRIYINTEHTESFDYDSDDDALGAKKLFSIRPSRILFHNHRGVRGMKFLCLSDGHRDALKIDAAIIFYSLLCLCPFKFPLSLLYPLRRLCALFIKTHSATHTFDISRWNGKLFAEITEVIHMNRKWEGEQKIYL
jgi:hypothetical protein